jgi:aspartate dehydrogenase
MQTSAGSLRVSFVGFGNVCRQVVDAVRDGTTTLDGMEFVAIGRREDSLSSAETDSYRGIPFCNHDEAVARADVIVEAAVPPMVPWLTAHALPLGKTVIVVSAAGLLQVPDLDELDRRGSGRLIVANGMMPGLDILRAAKESGIECVELTSRIKPESLRNEEYIEKNGISLPGPGDPEVVVFEGDAQTAARVFPRHFNVAIALSLAGVGMSETRIQVIADPTVRGAMHRVRVKAAAVDLDMTSYGYPSPANPKTSRLVAPSVIATLRGLPGVVRIGS